MARHWSRFGRVALALAWAEARAKAARVACQIAVGEGRMSLFAATGSPPAPLSTPTGRAMRMPPSPGRLRSTGCRLLRSRGREAASLARAREGGIGAMRGAEEGGRRLGSQTDTMLTISASLDWCSVPAAGRSLGGQRARLNGWGPGMPARVHHLKPDVLHWRGARVEDRFAAAIKGIIARPPGVAITPAAGV